MTEITNLESIQFALTAMQVISGLWHYGNFTNKESPGCVLNNELLGQRDNLSIREYLATPIGCCTDYTTLLAAVLEHNGYQGRVIVTSTHNFNEVKLNNSWWTLDANLGIAYSAPWDVVVDGKSDVDAYKFSHAGTTLGSKVFSQALSNFRVSAILSVASGLMWEFSKKPQKEWLLNRQLRNDISF
ncbi:transglutaminase-like domain-containing protein [Neopusillimonas maritima]|uniref:Transglutaminase-like domain-containing protein n=1 Tax=Neopusillimonas maritima TaxID=2026239 RepID=A0A3A1YVP4_9BURK|nr:transglutaminase-like domain-containing protein [Neopusillimonas maritima]RIY41605.1 hypothetical protein CJP73_06435 [Neopusillimonas maritima]